MIKKNFLYFKNLNLSNESIKLLKKKFNLIEVKNKLEAKNLKKKIKNIIEVIYCDPLYYYSKQFLKNFNNLKYLVSSTTGTDFINLDYCKKNNLKVLSLENDQKFLSTITPTAEHVFGLIFLLTRNYILALKSVNKGKFNRRPYGGYAMLSKMKIGIIGYGRLGKIVKKIARGFSMKTVVCDIKSINFKKNLNKIILESDIISLNIPSKGNRNFFSFKNFKSIKKPFFLINTSRGEIIDERFIISLLKKKKLLGYGTDVLKNEFKEEFDLKKNIIFKNRLSYNIVITPHIGGSTIDAWKLTENRVINNILKHYKF